MKLPRVNLLASINRVRYSRSTKTLYKSLDDALKANTHFRQVAQQGSYNDLARLINLNQFLLLCRRDLVLLISEVTSLRDPLKKQLQVRFLATLIYEFLDDLQIVLNRDFRNHVESMFDSVDIRKRFREVCSDLDRIRKSNQASLKEIRNTVAAHRDLDVTKQLTVMEKLDQEALISLAQEVSLRIALLQGIWIPVSFRKIHEVLKKSRTEDLLLLRRLTKALHTDRLTDG